MPSAQRLPGRHSTYELIQMQSRSQSIRVFASYSAAHSSQGLPHTVSMLHTMAAFQTISNIQAEMRSSPKVEQPRGYEGQAAGARQAQNAQNGQGPLHQALPDTPRAVQVHWQERKLGARMHSKEVFPQVKGVVPA